jgi:hypothetical protein
MSVPIRLVHRSKSVGDLASTNPLDPVRTLVKGAPLSASGYPRRPGGSSRRVPAFRASGCPNNLKRTPYNSEGSLPLCLLTSRRWLTALC